MSSNLGNFFISTCFPWTWRSSQSLRWYSWLVLWFTENFRIFRLSSRSKLSFLRRLCWLRKLKHWNHRFVVCLQSKIPWKFFPFERKSWMWGYKPNIWILWWMQEKIFCKIMENIFWSLQNSSCCCFDWRQNFVYAWRSFSRSDKY